MDKEPLGPSGVVISTSGELGFALQPTKTHTPANASARKNFDQVIFNLLLK
jgi:hypothetical protein